MIDVKSEVINAINGIDDVMMESTVNVYSTLSAEYDKLLAFMDYTHNGSDASKLYQEGEVWDQATGKYSGDGVIMKIIKFIPRLLIAIISAIGRVFTKDYKASILVSSTKAVKNLNEATDEQLNEIADHVKEISKGEIKLNKKKKTFTLGDKIKSIWNKGTLLMSGAKCLTRLRTEIKQPNTDYKKFAGELKDIFNDEKDFDEETVSIGVAALTQGLSDTYNGSLALSAACKELSGILEKKCEEEVRKGNSKKIDEIKDLIDQIQHTAAFVSKTSFLGNIGIKVVNFLGSDIAITKRQKAKARSGVDKLASKALERVTYIDQLDELEYLDQEITNVGRSASSKETQNKKEDKLHKKKQKKRKILDKLKKDDENASTNLERGRYWRNWDDEEYENEQNTP